VHEYPVTLEIIRIAGETAKAKNAQRVDKIALVIGDLSGYVGESVHMYFDEISKGTVCEGCRLEITRIRPKVKCSACGEVFERKPFSFECPVCGGPAGPTKIGTEFYIDHIEVSREKGGSDGDGTD
jgi:hydrogenase nickel incorporation protein HypA/HybF